MGQRSQIYIRIKDKYNNKHLIAKYFQWNYAERMISRAKYGIEYLYGQKDYLSLDNVVEQVRRIFDINFDMKDTLLSVNIIKEWLRDWQDDTDFNNFNDFVFNRQDNNDGKLFVDIDENKERIKYCFTDYDLQIFKSAKAYMDWDYENWLNSEYLSQKEIKTCLKNIQWLDKNADIMTDEELQDFLNDDYSSSIERNSKRYGIEILKKKGE